MADMWPVRGGGATSISPITLCKCSGDCINKYRSCYNVSTSIVFSVWCNYSVIMTVLDMSLTTPASQHSIVAGHLFKSEIDTESDFVVPD